MLYQIVIFFIIEDGCHYWSHRALHWGPLYKNIHKIHHQYSAPFGLAAEYASPIEVFVLGFGTVSVPIVWAGITGGPPCPDNVPLDRAPAVPGHRCS